LSRKSKNKSTQNIETLTEQAKKSFEKGKNYFDNEWKEFDKIINKNNISRMECLMLPINATLDALRKKKL